MADRRTTYLWMVSTWFVWYLVVLWNTCLLFIATRNWMTVNACDTNHRIPVQREGAIENDGFCALRFYDGFMVMENAKLLSLASLLGIDATDPVIANDAVREDSGSNLRILLSKLKPVTNLTAFPQPCSWNMLLHRRWDNIKLGGRASSALFRI